MTPLRMNRQSRPTNFWLIGQTKYEQSLTLGDRQRKRLL
jgi:hypothetical protein